MRIVTLVLAFAILSFTAIARAEEKHETAPHGGVLVEVGDEVAHIEVVQDKAAGKVELYILGADAKTPVMLKIAPKLAVKTSEGGKVIETTAVNAKDGAASQYSATDEALKQPLKGRVNLVIEGKKYNAEIKKDKDQK